MTAVINFLFFIFQILIWYSNLSKLNIYFFRYFFQFQWFHYFGKKQKKNKNFDCSLDKLSRFLIVRSYSKLLAIPTSNWKFWSSNNEWVYYWINSLIIIRRFRYFGCFKDNYSFSQLREILHNIQKYRFKYGLWFTFVMPASSRITLVLIRSGRRRRQ